ncbi:MAG: carbohydrate ABC transporter permease [Paenibacillaceae bacterium]
MRRKQKWLLGTTETILWICSIIIFIPYLLVVLTSIKNSKEAGLFNLKIPSEIHIIDNYKILFEKGHIIQGFFNSTFITSASVILVLFCSALLSFYIARVKSNFSSFLYNFVVIGMMTPISLVTTFDLLKSLHLLSTRMGVVMIFAGTLIPFATFIFVGFVKTIPREMDEASTIDGCGPYKMFLVIIIPLMKPITFTATILVFMSVWNDSQIVLFFLNNNNFWTMPLNIYRFFGYYSADWNYIFGNVFLTTLPVLILYLFGQRYIIEGMTSGAVKG